MVICNDSNRKKSSVQRVVKYSLLVILRKLYFYERAIGQNNGLFFFQMLVCLDLAVGTNLWMYRNILLKFLKLNHPYCHRINLLGNNV